APLAGQASHGTRHLSGSCSMKLIRQAAPAAQCLLEPKPLSGLEEVAASQEQTTLRARCFPAEERCCRQIRRCVLKTPTSEARWRVGDKPKDAGWSAMPDAPARALALTGLVPWERPAPSALLPWSSC